MMKPPNRNISIKIKVPMVVAKTIFWKIIATKRQKDVEDRCRAKRRRNWQKNLKLIGRI